MPNFNSLIIESELLLSLVTSLAMITPTLVYYQSELCAKYTSTTLLFWIMQKILI
jgi:hypothetical protein